VKMEVDISGVENTTFNAGNMSYMSSPVANRMTLAFDCLLLFVP
jgi:hypothetical protein